MTREERKADTKKAYAALMKFYPSTLENLDGEKWADIAGYEGLYQISTFGRVKSFNGLWCSEKILRPYLMNKGKGYLVIRLTKNGKEQSFLIHRLVASAFIPNPCQLPEVDHVYGMTFDNSIWNLRWATRLENMQAAVKLGLINVPCGQNSHKAKLTNEQVVYIRNNPDALNIMQLAQKFGVDFTAISLIQLGKTYKNAGGEIRKKIVRTGAKLTPAQVAEIRKNAEGLNVHQLAEKFKVDPTTISNVQTGKTYRNVSGTVRQARKRSQITDEICKKIRAEYKCGVYGCGTHVLAKKYGLSKKTVLKIVHEK